MELKPGSRWKSAVCDGEFVVVRPPSGGGELAWSFRPKGLARSTNMLASLCLVPFLVCAAERRWWLVVLFGATMLLFASAFAAYATARALVGSSVPLVTLQIADALSSNVVVGSENLMA